MMWFELAIERYDFQCEINDSAAVAELTLDTVVTFFELHLSPRSSTRRKLSSQACLLKTFVHMMMFLLLNYV